jgi:Glycosyl hydrolase catalytic core
MPGKRATVLLLVLGSLAAVIGVSFLVHSRRRSVGSDYSMMEQDENTPISGSDRFNSAAQKNVTTNLDAGNEIARTTQSRCFLDDLYDQKIIPAPPPLPGKKGMGMTLKPETWQLHLELIQMLNVSWNYSWGAKRIAAQPDDIEFIPMIWGRWSVLEQLEQDILPEFESNRIHRFFTFNEPDNADQSNVAVESVVDTYWSMFESAKIPMSSPAAMHPLGNWSREFCKHIESNCLRMEYTALHYYSGPNFALFKNAMMEAYELYGRRPILLTEFGVADWDAQTPEENSVRMDCLLGGMSPHYYFPLL